MEKSTSGQNSESKIILSKQLPYMSKNFYVLDTAAMVKGIGRKATDEELIHYLEKERNVDPICLDEAFSKYEIKK